MSRGIPPTLGYWGGKAGGAPGSWTAGIPSWTRWGGSRPGLQCPRHTCLGPEPSGVPWWRPSPPCLMSGSHPSSRCPVCRDGSARSRAWHTAPSIPEFRLHLQGGGACGCQLRSLLRGGCRQDGPPGARPGPVPEGARCPERPTPADSGRGWAVAFKSVGVGQVTGGSSRGLGAPPGVLAGTPPPLPPQDQDSECRAVPTGLLAGQTSLEHPVGSTQGP